MKALLDNELEMTMNTELLEHEEGDSIRDSSFIAMAVTEYSKKDIKRNKAYNSVNFWGFGK